MRELTVTNSASVATIISLSSLGLGLLICKRFSVLIRPLPQTPSMRTQAPVAEDDGPLPGQGP